MNTQEINFKAKSTSTKGWVFGDFTTKCPFPCGIYTDKGLFEVTLKTVSQYINLKDINEKKIYINDIVELTDQNNKKGNFVIEIEDGVIYFMSRKAKHAMPTIIRMKWKVKFLSNIHDENMSVKEVKEK